MRGLGLLAVIQPVEKVRKVEGTYYEMKSEFAEELKERLAQPKTSSTEGGFSFLAMVGRNHSAQEKETERPQRHTPLLPSNGHRTDASETPSGVSTKLHRDHAHKNGDTAVQSSSDRPCFFLSLEDPEIRQPLASFRRLASRDRVAEVFKKHRESHVKVTNTVSSKFHS